MSTILLIVRIPIAFNFSFNQSGEAPTLTPEIRTPEYLGHASVFLTSTVVVFAAAGVVKPLTSGSV